MRMNSQTNKSMLSEQISKYAHIFSVYIYTCTHISPRMSLYMHTHVFVHLLLLYIYICTYTFVFICRCLLVNFYCYAHIHTWPQSDKSQDVPQSIPDKQRCTSAALASKRIVTASFQQLPSCRLTFERQRILRSARAARLGNFEPLQEHVNRS